jgi:hypothetical protein
MILTGLQFPSTGGVKKYYFFIRCLWIDKFINQMPNHRQVFKKYSEVAPTVKRGQEFFGGIFYFFSKMFVI